MCGRCKQINDSEMMHGIVVGLTKTDVVINIGFQVTTDWYRE